MTRIEIKQVDQDYAFEGIDSNGHTARMDAGAATGGHDSGIRPMQTLLMGLGGCSGIDIVSILKKQRQEIKSFNMIIEGERESGQEPSLWKEINIVFQFTGNVDEDKANKACALSMDKYCSVAATLRAAGCTLNWRAEVNKP